MIWEHAFWVVHPGKKPKLVRIGTPYRATAKEVLEIEEPDARIVEPFKLPKKPSYR
jgi:hypothetical protein